MAHLPFQRTLDQFDFAFQPSIDERQVNELAAWPSWQRPATFACWDLPAWARLTRQWHWPIRPSRTDMGPTSSAPKT